MIQTKLGEQTVRQSEANDELCQDQVDLGNTYFIALLQKHLFLLGKSRSQVEKIRNFLGDQYNKDFKDQINSNCSRPFDEFLRYLGQQFINTNYHGLIEIQNWVKEYFHTNYKKYEQLQIQLQAKKDSKGINEALDLYLRSVACPRSELNLFCQLMGVSYPKINRIRLENKEWMIFGRLTVEEGKHFAENVTFETESHHREKKIAQAQAVFSLVKTVYRQFPSQWQQFRADKNSRGIIC